MISKNDKIILHGTAVPFLARVNQKAKRFILRYDPTNNLIKLTLPPFYKNRDVQAFIKNAQSWLEKQFSTHKTHFEKTESIPTHLTILGQHTSITFQESVKHHFWQDTNSLIIRCPKNMQIIALKQHLKTLAAQHFTQKSSEFALKTGKDILKIYIGDAKTRWESCSSAGRLTFSWRLMLSPRAVADYVCAHEVAHLTEMNHSQKFWSLVQTLCPDYLHHRRWLKENGHALLKVL